MLEFLELKSSKDKYFAEAIEVYREAFESTPEIYLDPKYFSQGSSSYMQDMQWHFCALVDRDVIGMAAFASTKFGGYSGYVAVRERLRHRGYGTILLKNIVDNVRKDLDKNNWKSPFLFAEYENKNQKLWESKGFVTLPVKYYQPPLVDDGNWVSMNLGVLPLSGAESIRGEEIVDFVSFMYSRIYWMKGYSKYKQYKELKKSCYNLVFKIR